MLKDLIKKENEFASQIIASYEEEIKKTEQDISYIDDKYKKLAEEEKKSLNDELAELKNRLSQWKASVISEVSEGDETKTEKEPEITDTLYPENNESPCNSSDEPTEEKRQEEEVSDEPAAFESVELDEHPEVTEDWEEETEAEANEDDDDWGEPKDWN